MIKWAVLLVLLLMAAPVFAQTTTPSPSPTPQLIIPSGDISEAAQQGADGLNSIGDSLTSTNGTSLVPSVDWGMIFGYIKWLIAPPTGDELAGPFGPVFVALGALLTTEITFIAIKGIVFVAVYALSWGIWIFKLIITILTFIVNVISALPGIVLGFFGL